MAEAPKHRYRDQERTAQAQAAEARAREGYLHRLVRAWRTLAPLELQAPLRVLLVLDRWAVPVLRHLTKGENPVRLDSDSRARTIESTPQYLDGQPNALT